MSDITQTDQSVTLMYKRGSHREYLSLTREELEKMLADLPDQHLRELRDMKQQQTFDLQQLTVDQAEEMERIKAAIAAL